MLSARSMTSWHPMGERQVRGAFPGGAPELPELEAFLAAVSQAYHQMTELEQVMVERTTELDQRNRNMTLLLNNVAQGFATVDLDGTIRAECSQAFTRWFGAPG